MNMTIIAHTRKYAAAATKIFERERELTFVSSSFEAHLIIYKQQHLIIFIYEKHLMELCL